MSYSPKIKPELVRELYLLKHSNERKTPMTKLVNEAVTQYLERKRKYGKQEIDSNRNELTEAIVEILKEELSDDKKVKGKNARKQKTMVKRNS